MFTQLRLHLFLAVTAIIGFNSLSTGQTIVQKYGQLQVNGAHLLSENGDTVQLRGMSLFWSQWMPQYYNHATVKWLKNDWKCTVVRAAMGVEHGGYLENPQQEQEKVEKVIDAAIEEGIYVIVDYHAHKAHKNASAAKNFFSAIAQKYGQYPNIIYETYNEPLAEAGWNKILKPYHEEIIAAIRKYDQDNLILCGTRLWSQKVDEAARNPINDPNIAYTLHYYAVSHKDKLRKTAIKALESGIPIFVSEQGNCHASGNGQFSKKEAKIWYEFLDKHKISWCKWSVANKDETAAAIKPNVKKLDKWEISELTASGVTLTGPGIKESTTLSLPEVDAFQANQALFPLGLDFIFACGSQLAALPRTTKVS